MYIISNLEFRFYGIGALGVFGFRGLGFEILGPFMLAGLRAAGVLGCRRLWGSSRQSSKIERRTALVAICNRATEFRLHSV